MKHLHIIAFDIPLPANYGGAIDVFYRLKALHEQGVAITLHCFDYARPHNDELNNYCEKVHYYKRDTSLRAQFHLRPYTVVSRQNTNLLRNLLNDEHSILFEGLMCCGFLDDVRLKSRIKLVRPHNVEHAYYFGLAKATKNIIKKAYYAIEALKLAKYESVLCHADAILALSTKEQAHFQLKFPKKSVYFFPCFHQHETLNLPTGRGQYILYHGNLQLSENEQAVRYLCRYVFSKLNFPCVVAGLNPKPSLQKFIQKYPNVKLVASPTKQAMDKLIREAQINILITHQNTGLKLKLLHALFAGRFVIANSDMLTGSGLETLCHKADSAEAQIACCKELFNKTFDENDLRQAVLVPNYINSEQAQRLICLF